MFFGVVMELLDLSLRQKVMTHAATVSTADPSFSFPLSEWDLLLVWANKHSSNDEKGVKTNREFSRNQKCEHLCVNEYHQYGGCYKTWLSSQMA